MDIFPAVKAGQPDQSFDGLLRCLVNIEAEASLRLTPCRKHRIGSLVLKSAYLFSQGGPIRRIRGIFIHDVLQEFVAFTLEVVRPNEFERIGKVTDRPDHTWRIAAGQQADPLILAPNG